MLLSPRKTRKPSPLTKKVQGQSVKMTSARSESGETEEQRCSMLACFCSEKSSDDKTAGEADKMDKVEFAFRKFDSDGDGFLSWEEFQQVDTMAQQTLEDLLNIISILQLVKNLDQEQALRIFHSCNQVRTAQTLNL